MCGRYTLFADPGNLASRFDVSVPDWFEQSYNCAPGEQLPVITNTAPETLTRKKWGLTPAWADESFDLINARAETVREKRSFASAYEQRRCLVPADGFYEWTSTDESARRPYRVAFDDDRLFAMAGLYERWIPPTRQSGLAEFATGSTDAADPVETFTILTTEPNGVVSDLHDRMAVILPPEREGDWLHGDPDELTDLLRPYPGAEMESYPVSPRVNDPTNDDSTLIEENAD